MSAGFDPYHRWLSIPSSEQPPTHYRILGLPPFESDLQVIESAALRQIAHVRSFLETPMRTYAVNLIHELSVARQCLIKSESKAAYDAWLRQLTPTPTPTTANSTPRPHLIESAAPTTALQASVRRRSATATKQSPASAVAQRAVSSPNDWIDTVPVDNGSDNFWPPEQQGAAPDIDFQPRLTIKRRRKKSPLAILFSLIMWGIGTAAGILAGYAVLCIADSKYDYLNLFTPHKIEPVSVTSATAGPNDLSLAPPTHQQKPTLRPQKPRDPDVAGASSPSGRTQPRRTDQSDAVKSESPTLAAPTHSDVDLLASFPNHVPLPARMDADQQTLLASMPPIAAEQQTLFEIVDGGDNEKGSISLAKPESPVAENRWTVQWVPFAADGPTSNSIPTEIGAFTVDSGVLNFSWKPGAPIAAATALRNSLLQLKMGAHDQAIALRDPEIGPPLVIDLKSPIARATCKCESPPRPVDVKVDVVNLVDFPPYRVEGTSLSGLKLGDKVTLWYTDVEGAATRISILRIGSLAAIQAESRYRLPSGDEEGMSVLLGNRKLKQLQKKCDDAVAARNQIPAIQHYLSVEAPTLMNAARNIQTMEHLPSGAYVENPTLALEKRQAIARISKDVQSATNQLAKLNNLADLLSEGQADLAALEKVSELAQRVQNAKLCYRFYRVVGQREIDLVVNE